MEKISMKVVPSGGIGARAVAGLSASRLANASMACNPASRREWSGCADEGEFLDFLESANVGAMMGLSSDATDLWTAPVDPLPSQADDRGTDDPGATHVDAPEESCDPQAQLQGVPVAASTIEPLPGSTSTNDRPAAWDVDLSSTDQFTIDHPRWGLIEVDSRRSASSWDLTVRCADADTRQRLQDHEQDFHALLSRDYGASLSLDLQPVARR